MYTTEHAYTLYTRAVNPGTALPAVYACTRTAVYSCTVALCTALMYTVYACAVALGTARLYTVDACTLVRELVNEWALGTRTLYARILYGRPVVAIVAEPMYIWTPVHCTDVHLDDFYPAQAPTTEQAPTTVPVSMRTQDGRTLEQVTTEQASTTDLASTVRALRAQGITWSEVAKRTGVSVYRAKKLYASTPVAKRTGS